MKERGTIRMLVLLASALALAGFLAGCAGGGGGKPEENPAAPQEETKNEEREQTEETTSPNAEKDKAKAETETKSKAEPKAQAAPSEPTPPTPKEEEVEYDVTAMVTRVADGDTVRISPAVDGIDEVRLIGVDTPETKEPGCDVQPYGSQASAFTQAQLGGQEVGLEFDVERTDRYDRLLAYVHKDGEMFNETLLREGYAQVATFPPNVRYVERFRAAQDEARAAGRGLWGLSADQLAQQTDRGNGIGGNGCAQKAQPKTPPKQQPRPTPKPTPEPKQKTPAAPKGDVDCEDFSTKAEAQAYLLPGDPHRLDRDGDGQACDSLP